MANFLYFQSVTPISWTKHNLLFTIRHSTTVRQPRDIRAYFQCSFLWKQLRSQFLFFQCSGINIKQKKIFEPYWHLVRNSSFSNFTCRNFFQLLFSFYFLLCFHALLLLPSCFGCNNFTWPIYPKSIFTRFPSKITISISSSPTLPPS